MNKLPIILLAACTSIPPECEDELERTEQACDSAEVIGKHDNVELYGAIDDLRECVAYDIKVICSDDGYQKILTVTRK